MARVQVMEHEAFGNVIYAVVTPALAGTKLADWYPLTSSTAGTRSPSTKTWASSPTEWPCRFASLMSRC